MCVEFYGRSKSVGGAGGAAGQVTPTPGILVVDLCKSYKGPEVQGVLKWQRPSQTKLSGRSTEGGQGLHKPS